MTVESVQLYRYSLPLLVRPSRTGDQNENREGILVRMISDGGETGWGEIAPLPGFSPESLGEAESVAITEAERLVGHPVPKNLESWTSSRSIRNTPSVQFGLELAMSSLSARIRGTTLASWISASARKQVAVSALLSGSSNMIETAVQEGLRAGFSVFKLKVGRHDVEEDIRRVRAVRGALGPAAQLRLDANRAWEYSEARHFLSETNEYDITYIEEPLRNPLELKQLHAQTGAHLALDESAGELFYSLDSGQDFREWAFLTAVILKPTIVGGMTRTLLWASRFNAMGVEPVLSSAFETIIGVGGVRALAAAVPGSGWAAGLDTLKYLGATVLRDYDPAIADIPDPAMGLDPERVDLNAIERIF